jgi:[ribosomal protein S18]-alanine N-acetyltransferase
VTAVRRMRPSDASFVVALSAEAFSEYSNQAESRALPLTRGPGVTTLVAEWRGQRAGFAVLRMDDRGGAHLDAIAVTDRARGHGVGRALLAEIELEASNRAARALSLVTADSNLAALGLFLRAGFDIVRRIPRHYPRGQDAVMLRKVLRYSSRK